MKLVVPALLVACALFGAGCPEERKAVVDDVGGNPRAQVDNAQQRLDRAEKKLEGRAAEADAAKE